jgi:hypothetical protein
MEVNDQLNIPTIFTPKKSPQYPVGMRLGESKSGLDATASNRAQILCFSGA